MSRIVRHLYYTEKIIRVGDSWRYTSTDDGTLYSDVFKTKIRPTDLPEWYLFGRYHKRHGYMSTKGIVDLVYQPNWTLGTFLKDDFLLISYHGHIEKIPDEQIARRSHFIDQYRGYDDYIYGNEIMTILKGAAKYSNFDINPIAAQIKEKLGWVMENYPCDYKAEKWSGYVGKTLANGITDYERHR